VASLALPLLPACGGGSTRHTVGASSARKLPPVDPEALREFDRGLRALRRGGPSANERAADRFRAAVGIDDKLWEGWHDLGKVLLDDGDDTGAVEAFSRAIEINPKHRDSIAGRAAAQRLAGNTEEAAKDYRRLIDLEPDSLSNYARLASLLRRSERYEDGLDVLREGLRVGGESSGIYVELGLIYLAQGRDELAELVLSKAAKLDEKNPATYNALALLAMAHGEDQLAFQHFDRAAELDPGYADARFNKASVLIDAGDYESARVELEALAQARPDDLDLQVALGIAFRGLGNLDRARSLWNQVVDAAPQHSSTRSDALFNLAILEMNFIMDDDKAKAALDRYLQSSSPKHAKHKEAKMLRKELGE
jgi:tetratricopeptide (TPR) repeat protein